MAMPPMNSAAGARYCPCNDDSHVPEEPEDSYCHHCKKLGHTRFWCLGYFCVSCEKYRTGHRATECPFFIKLNIVNGVVKLEEEEPLLDSDVEVKVEEEEPLLDWDVEVKVEEEEPLLYWDTEVKIEEEEPIL
ncbi:hypothetical protein EVJ58_g7262 [Rhodofomes roseus]|uniref:CCHC-type domain-containing protein n=1 Tax=Rhodofomes roseus TaxID=34475 RepID=A0A4Y9Y5I0_9APHY|nr:hypothetical protein EVJ58_g7262 [Rhodofomes roseus]